MIKIYKTNESTGKLETVQSPIKGCWINMVAPTKEEIDYLYEEYFDNSLTNTKDKFNLLKENIYNGSDNYIKELKDFFQCINYKY